MVAAVATKLSPGRSAQQSKTEIEQIPDKLEFGLVFLLLFCSLMFFLFLFSFRLRCQRNFLTFFLLLFLPFCCVFLAVVSATFPRKISSQIFASYYDYFYIAFRPLLLLQLYCSALWKMTLYNSCNLFLLLFPVAPIPFFVGQNVWSGCHPEQRGVVEEIVSVNVICCYWSNEWGVVNNI